VLCSKQCSLDLLSFLLEIAFRVLHPRRETALTLEEMLVSTILLAALLVASHIGQFQWTFGVESIGGWVASCLMSPVFFVHLHSVIGECWWGVVIVPLLIIVARKNFHFLWGRFWFSQSGMKMIFW
jgi:hypothetical protein